MIEPTDGWTDESVLALVKQAVIEGYGIGIVWARATAPEPTDKMLAIAKELVRDAIEGGRDA
mgnify:CR=1 FL=1